MEIEEAADEYDTDSCIIGTVLWAVILVCTLVALGILGKWD
jgi:hypothetical protein